MFASRTLRKKYNTKEKQVEYIHETVLHTLEHSAILLPFLFLTYLFMEFLEHKTGERAERAISRAGRVGPLFGGLLGAVPQCGFSAAASGLFAGRVITVGTLIAVFLATSDEMVAVMLSSAAKNPENIKKLLIILAIKVVGGILVGFAVDLIFGKRHAKHTENHGIGDICEHENCHCHEKNIFVSALIHSLKIWGFILFATFVINNIIYFVGEDSIGKMMHNIPVLGEFLAGIIGLIPNCASSVVLTELYLGGVITGGQLLSGLFTGAGIGVLVLFRSNRRIKENLMILCLLYLTGVGLGLIVGLTGVL